MENLFFFSGSVTSFFVFLLLSKRKKTIYDWFLVAWFAVILFHIIVFYLSSKNQYTFLLEISSAFVFLNGPLIWFYTWFLFNRGENFKWTQIIHFIPFILNLIFIFPFVVQQNLAPFSDLTRMLLSWAKLVSILFYCLRSLRIINQKLRIIAQFLSNIETYHVKWLKMALKMVLVIWILGFLSQVIFQVNLLGLDANYEDIALNLAVSILVIFMGYYGFKQAPIFVGDFLLTLDSKPWKEEGTSSLSERYQKSSMSADDIKHYAELLESLMSSEKLFTDPDLSLSKLAIKIGLSTNQLSQVINQFYQKNFYDFVNSFRVEEVKRRLVLGEMKYTTLLGIGLEAGFNSKASFNRCFKKHVGKTPSEFLDSDAITQNQ
jgi:AraC-like DNA-binding protein